MPRASHTYIAPKYYGHPKSMNIQVDSHEGKKIRPSKEFLLYYKPEISHEIVNSEKKLLEDGVSHIFREN